jgi:hypothetical protein
MHDLPRGALSGHSRPRCQLCDTMHDILESKKQQFRIPNLLGLAFLPGEQLTWLTPMRLLRQLNTRDNRGRQLFR